MTAMDSSLAPITETEVRNLLEASRGKWPEVAQKAGVSYSWLSKFFCKHIDNPGIDTLRKVRSAIHEVNGRA